jgi:hypothetical protein
VTFRGSYPHCNVQEDADAATIVVFAALLPALVLAFWVFAMIIRARGVVDGRAVAFVAWITDAPAEAVLALRRASANPAKIVYHAHFGDISVNARDAEDITIRFPSLAVFPSIFGVWVAKWNAIVYGTDARCEVYSYLLRTPVTRQGAELTKQYMCSSAATFPSRWRYVREACSSAKSRST